MIISDFNNVLNITKRVEGNEVQMAEFIDLERMMEETSLYEHETKGCYFTWSNKHTNGIIYSRIYMVI